MRGCGFENWRSLEESGESWVIGNALPRIVQAENPVFVDVGAHTGEYSTALISKFPKATVHAFEPHPRTFERLAKAVGDRISCHRMALGSSVTSMDLYDRKKSDGSELASLSLEGLEAVRRDELVSHRVAVSTLDQFCSDHGIDAVDLLKIDTEGFEMDVLEGASTVLAGGQIRCVQFEFNQMHVGRRQFLADFMHRLPGHRLYRVLSGGLIPLDRLRTSEREIFSFQNILAVPVELATLWT
jgi:FkbM family methyltransferase